MSWQAPELVRRIAAARTRCHIHSKSNNQPADDPNNTSIVGVSGEWLFAQEFSLPYTFAQGALQMAGDGGIDFAIELSARPKPLTIDVKTARIPRWLYVQKDKAEGRAEIFVLCKYDDELGPRLMGWEWASWVRRFAKTKMVEGGKEPTEVYYWENELLRPMQELRDLIDSYKRRVA